MSPGMNDIGYGRTTSDSKFRKKRQEEKESKSTQGKKPVLDCVEIQCRITVATENRNSSAISGQILENRSGVAIVIIGSR